MVGFASALLALGLSGQLQGFAQDPKVEKAAEDPYVVWSVAISPDGKAMAAGAGWWTTAGEVGVWDLTTYKPLRHFKEDRGIVSVVFSPNSKLLAFAGWTQKVRVLDWAENKELIDFPLGALGHVAFSPDGSLLATASEAQTLLLWDLVMGELHANLDGDLLRFHRVAFSPDGKRLLAGGGDWKKGGTNHLGVWDMTSKKQVLKLTGHENTVYCLACSPDGKWIATGSVDRTIRLYDAETGLFKKALRGAMREVDHLAFTADSKTLLSGGPEPAIRFWDVEEGKEIKQLDTGISHVRAFQLTPDDTTLIVGGQEKTLKVFSLESGKQLAVLWNEPEELPMDLLPASTPSKAEKLSSRSHVRPLVLALAVALAVGLIVCIQIIRRRQRVAEMRRSPSAL